MGQLAKGLADADRDRIAAAVADAETRTSGEIVCVVAHRVSTYAEVPLAWAAAVALVAPSLAVALGARPLALSSMFGEWMVGHVAALDTLVAAAIGIYALVQAALFLAAWLVFSIPAVRRTLTPGFIKAARVRQAALAQYVATGLPVRDDATGVVIFASLDDHRVEVIAEPAIDARTGKAAWDKAVAAVVDGMRAGRPGDGFVRAVQLCGEVLAEHFPDDGGANRMPDRPVEI
jgi:putative membrane protein